MHIKSKIVIVDSAFNFTRASYMYLQFFAYKCLIMVVTLEQSKDQKIQLI